MKEINNTFRFVIICLYIVKSLGKNVISISLDSSKKNAEENDIEVELFQNKKNQSRDNFFSTYSSSFNYRGKKKESKFGNSNVKYTDSEVIHENTENTNLYENTESPGMIETGDSIYHRKVLKSQNLDKSKNYVNNILVKPKRTHNFRNNFYSCGRTKTEPTSRNSTIEAGDHEYQANIEFKENGEMDKDSLADYYYTASIQRKGAHYTSGALVGERWVLTTAAEFYNVRETIKLFRIRLGSTDCKKGGVVIPIKSIIIHPDFTLGKPGFDVSVLMMAEPVPVSAGVKAIEISRIAGNVVGGMFITTYWPKIVVKQGVIPPTAKERLKYNSMRVSTQSLVPSEECGRQFSTVNMTLRKSSLCLKPVELHHSVCMPDVGAPVVAIDGLWGITSGWVSPKCPESLLPTVVTRVTLRALRTWIDNNLHQ